MAFMGPRDYLAKPLAYLGTLPFVLGGLVLGSVFMGGAHFLNGFDPPKHYSVRAFLIDWGEKVIWSFSWFCLIAGIWLLVHPGHYNRLLALPLFLPAVLIAIYIWHRRRLARIAATFRPPLTPIS